MKLHQIKLNCITISYITLHYGGSDHDDSFSGGDGDDDESGNGDDGGGPGGCWPWKVLRHR